MDSCDDLRGGGVLGESVELARREHEVRPRMDGTGDVVRCERCPVHAARDQLAQQQRPGREKRPGSERCGVSIVRGVEPRSCSSRLSRERSNPGMVGAGDVLEKKKGDADGGPMRHGCVDDRCDDRS